MKTLYKILWKDQGKSHLTWALLGSLAGFVLLQSGLQFYSSVRDVLRQNRDLLDPEYIVVNKSVSIGQAFGFGGKGFTEEEISEIAAQPFASRVAAFIANEFPVSAYTESERFPDFYTELFFEAVPDEFIDVKSEDWHWEEGQETIPLIMPREYLNLYNFGFAQSQGLPQIPGEVIGMVRFYVKLKGRREQPVYPGKIVGFSNRINSILVPYDFLEWANEKYGYTNKYKPSRVIVVANDPTDPAIIQFLEEKGYETIRERLKSSRLNIILKFIISFLVIIAAIIIGLALLVFILAIQLMISRSADKIRRLNRLGYHYLEISAPYIVIMLLLLAGVTIVSLLITSVLSSRFAAMATEWNLDVSSTPENMIYLVSVGLIILIFSINTAAILLSARRLCK